MAVTIGEEITRSRPPCSPHLFGEEQAGDGLACIVGIHVGPQQRREAGLPPDIHSEGGALAGHLVPPAARGGECFVWDVRGIRGKTSF
jgi:hypothetical protein